MPRLVMLAAAVMLAIAELARADAMLSIGATADAFVRELAPDSNYGGGGLLCVGGADSANGVGEPRGQFESCLRISLASVPAAFDAALGAGQWEITGVTLRFAHVVAPDNPLFPRGVGGFDVAWFIENSWIEGTGSPNSPVPGDGGLMCWTQLQAILAANAEHALGSFVNDGVTGVHDYPITTDAALNAALHAGETITLHLAPRSPTLGFTFHSRNFGDPAQRPQFIVTAATLVRGDMNCDGVVNDGDAALFVMCLLDPDAYAAGHPACGPSHGDFDGNGLVDGDDVQGFVSAVLAG